MAKKYTQNMKVLKHLQTHKRGITPLDAFERYGIERLSGRIWDLRHDGYEIKTTMVAVKNRFGDTCHVARYTLEE